MTACGGCARGPERHDCVGAFGRLGVLKAHWECWSNCNLTCRFCYRTRAAPLATGAAMRLLDAIRFGGCNGVIFAGGDPSLRNDIEQLVGHAQSLALKVEIQTNADHIPLTFRRALLRADLIGLSVDGATSEVHDTLRGRRGNLERTLDLLDWLEENGKPVLVRSVVLRQNSFDFAEIAKILMTRSNIVRWSILEFSEVGEGYTNRSHFSCDDSQMDAAIADAQATWRGTGQLDVYRNDAKAGAYLLLTPAGLAYGTTGVVPPSGVFPTVGSLLDDHLAELASALPFVAERHRQRYAALLNPVNQP